MKVNFPVSTISCQVSLYSEMGLRVTLCPVVVVQHQSEGAFKRKSIVTVSYVYILYFMERILFLIFVKLKNYSKYTQIPCYLLYFVHS